MRLFRYVVIAVLVSLLSSPALAETLREASLKAARTEALQPTGVARGPMPKGLLWTGVGLLGAGGLTLLMGAAVKNGECSLDFQSDCDDLGTGFYVLGGALAGTGAALMIVASAKRERLPSIAFTPRGGVTIRQRFSF